MHVKQHHFINSAWVEIPGGDQINAQNSQLLLVFGSGEMVTQPEVFQFLRAQYPNADIVFASTSGEIIGDRVFDNTVAVTAIEFHKTIVKSTSTVLKENRNSYDTGRELMQTLYSDDLTHVFLISDGTQINGSELVAGCNSLNTRMVPVTGGLAGDSDRFQKTFTGLNEVPTEGNVVAVGLYGNSLVVGHGSLGGWDEFGHERSITRADKNILYEIDNRSALDLYKEYLGDYVKDLPGSALLFPLALRKDSRDNVVVRTILAINEADASMTFAGNMPEGAKVRLMKANFDKLIDASANAATSSFTSLKDQKPDLAILISCVGRKLILQQRIDEEVEAANEIFGVTVPISGFYSFGEISPYNPSAQCELHNQTMTITTLTEV
jgi:hypothetical protein